MTKLIPFVVLAVATVGCAEDNIAWPTGSDSMVLSSVSNVEISAADTENLLLLEACLDLEVRLMEARIDSLIASVQIGLGIFDAEMREEQITKIGKESRDALQNCLERR